MLRLFAASFVRSLPYALVPVVLLFGLTAASYVFFAHEAHAAHDAADGTWAVYLILAVLLLSPALMAPLVYQMHANAHGGRHTVSEALGRGARCFLPCVAAAALFLVAIGIGSVLLVLPGVYLFVALSFWWLALVVDRMTILQALSASLRLVRGRWWHVAVGYSLIYPLAIVVNALDVNMVSLPDEVLQALVATLIALLSMTLLPMFVSANMVVVYHDLTLRREGAHAS